MNREKRSAFWLAVASFLFLKPVFILGQGLSEGPAEMPAFFSQPLFSPGAISQELPSFEDLGNLKEFNQDQAGTGLEIFSQISHSPLASALAAPVIKELSPDSLSQIKKDIETAVHSDNAQERKALVLQISERLKEAQRKASPKVFAALKSYCKQLQTNAQSGVNAQAFNQSNGLDQALLPLAKVYAHDRNQEELIKNVSRDLSSIQARHVAETLKPFWKSGQNPEESSYAGQLLKNPSLYEASAAQQMERSDGALGGKNTRPVSPLKKNLLAQTPSTNDNEGDSINIGNQSVKRVLFPNNPNGGGDDVPSILAAGNLASQRTQIALYEETLDQDADSILEGARQGKSYEVIIDYSNLFPQKMGRENQDAHRVRSPQLQKLVDAYLAGTPNLKLYVLKGLAKFGIQHSKYRVWNIPLADGKNSQILETGSYNYSAHTQASNWENVVLTDDQKLIDLYQKDFAWMKSVARVFSEDLEPQEPALDTPIPTAGSLDQNFNGVPLPIATFSPAGGTDDTWIKIVKAAKQEIFIGMFAFYPWPSMMSAITERLSSGLPVRILADQGQSHNVASMAALRHLKEAGAQVRVIGGANNGGLFHNKIVIGDPRGDGIVATGSTNMSINGTRNNFENTLYLKGGYLSALTGYLEALWNLGTEADFSQASQGSPNPGPENHSPAPGKNS